MRTGFRYIIAQLFMLSSAFCYGQANIDSLIRLSSSVSSDTERVNLLNMACREMNNNDLAKSKECAYKALELAQKADFKKGIIESYKNIGNILANQSDYKSSIENYLQALKLSESISDKRNISKILHDIGEVYTALGVYDKALENYFKSVELDKQFNDQKGVSISYASIGIVYANMNKLEQSLSYFEKSLEICKEINYADGMWRQYENIGEIYFDMGKHQDALNSLSESLKISYDLKSIQGVESAKIVMGKVYLQTGEFKQSEANFLSALDLSKQIGFQEDTKDCYKGLSDMYEKAGDDKKAFRYQKLYMQKKDSINSNDVSIKINEMQSNYEQQKREKEIALQNQERELTQQAEIDKQTMTKRYLMVGVILLLILAGVIFDKYRAKNKSNISLAEKNKEIAEKNKDILASIRYAKRIQQSLMPTEKYINKTINRLNR